MQIEIPPELARFVEQEIANGHFPSQEDMVLAGLQRLKQDRDETVRGIQDGLAEWERGEGTPLDEGFAKLRSKLGLPDDA